MSGVYSYSPESDQWGYDEGMSKCFFYDPDGFYHYLKQFYRGPKIVKIQDRYWKNCWVSKYETNITKLKRYVYRIV